MEAWPARKPGLPSTQTSLLEVLLEEVPVAGGLCVDPDPNTIWQLDLRWVS